MQIPRLLLDAKPDAALQIVRYVASAPLQTVELDAGALAVIQPVSRCLLANAARSAQCAGKQLLIRNASQKVRRALADLAASVELRGEGNIESWQGPMFAMAVTSQSEANAVANRISQRIAEFIPAEDRAAMLQDRLPDEKRHKLEAPYQGTIVSLEFHRRAATTRTIQDILMRYQGAPHLRARFD